MKKTLALGLMLVVCFALTGCSTIPDTGDGITADPPTSYDPSGTSGGDRDCGDFSTHAQAQAYFEAKGGSSSNNVDRLDRDSDGIACETLP